VSKSKLKANMLRFFREIEASGEEMIVTDRGYPEDPDTPTIDEWPVT
jgi:hypothetical protein